MLSVVPQVMKPILLYFISHLKYSVHLDFLFYFIIFKFNNVYSRIKLMPSNIRFISIKYSIIG